MTSLHRSLLGLLALTPILVAASALAGDGSPARVEAGDPSVDGSFLKPYENQWTFSIQKKGGEAVVAGTWTDSVESTTVNGRPALKRTQVASYKNGIRLTFVNVFDPKTMESFSASYERSDTGERRQLEYRGKEITFHRSPGTGDAPAQQYVATVEQRVLDFHDGLYGVLLDALPLRTGYEATLPAFDTDRACVDWVDVRVAGRETVEAGPGKSADTWVVRVETKKYGKSTWWLTREAPYVIQAKLEMPESEGGFSVWYRMTRRA
jgi:hypothetical protein